MNDPVSRPRALDRHRPVAVLLTLLVLAAGLAWATPPDALDPDGAPPAAERSAQEPPQEPPEAGGEMLAAALAREAADALTADLMSALRAEMQAGGPGAAIRVCSEVAQEIAAVHSTGGMTVRRVSRRPRNPAGRPDAYEGARLEEWEETVAAGEELPADSIERLDTEDGPVLRAMRPITIQPLCLQCHGDPESFSPEVRAVLAERYPEDEAVGYEAGDLRGAISVTVPLR